MEAAIIVTYRCNAQCHMCNIWKYPTDVRKEITPNDLKKLPKLDFANITGGEPFLREDIEDIVKVVLKRTKRLVISTNGYFTEKIVALAKKYPNIGIRVSIEGLPKANDELRGLKDGFDHGIRTLVELHNLGLKDIGFGITVSDRNAKDMMELYHLAKMLNLEFATAAMHNTYYFHKFDNKFNDKKMITEEFKKLIKAQLRSKKPKEWFRAYFNYGLINYINGNKRLLPCGMGTDVIFIDPVGEVYPCNGMDWSMGNIKKQTFEEIWNSEKAKDVRIKVKNCKKNCWMVGSASPAIKREKVKVMKWIVKGKLKGVDFKDVE